MILDRIDNATRYRAIGDRLALALAALAGGDLNGKPDGRYDLDGDDVFALVQRYQTKPHEQCVWEAHRRYVDVQFVSAGVEVMGWLPLADARERVAYDPAKDVAFFEPPDRGGRTAPPTLAVVSAGLFAIFFPTDVHMPQAMHGSGAADVGKVVVKVAV